MQPADWLISPNAPAKGCAQGKKWCADGEAVKCRAAQEKRVFRNNLTLSLLYERGPLFSYCSTEFTANGKVSTQSWSQLVVHTSIFFKPNTWSQYIRSIFLKVSPYLCTKFGGQSYHFFRIIFERYMSQLSATGCLTIVARIDFLILNHIHVVMINYDLLQVN